MSLSARLGYEPAANRRQRASDPVYEVRLRVQRRLAEELGPTLDAHRAGEDDLSPRVREVLTDLLAREQTPLSGADRARITKEVVDEVLGHGPIEPLLRDPSVTEVMVNGPKSVYVERYGRLEPTEAEFDDEAHLRRVIDRICARVGRRVDEASPMVDARLPDGSRVNAVVPPIALDGSSLTVRKFSASPPRVGDLVSAGTLSRPAAEFLECCVRGRRNLVVSGGTGSGRTTILNALAGFVPAGERIVTIEDAAELRLDQDHVIRLESRPAGAEGRGAVTTRDLVRNALRMRPDRIVVGEVRDGAALDLLQAMNTGHDGSLTTLHASTPRDALSRLETMVLVAGTDLPSRAIRDQIASAVDLIVHVTRAREGSRRVTRLTEVTGLDGDIVTTQDLFALDGDHATLRPTGVRPRFADAMAAHGVVLPAGGPR